VSSKSNHPREKGKTLENVKGEFESFGELPSVRETVIEDEIQQ
jgi:hypothetical protein